MDRSYVKDFVVSSFIRNELDVSEYNIDVIIDSVLFDWNEIGDPEEDFEALVDWNVDTYLSHNTPSGEGTLKRIKFWESDNFIPYPSDWIDQPSKPNSKYFYLRNLRSGWDEVRYFLDKKSNIHLYGKKIVEQLEI